MSADMGLRRFALSTIFLFATCLASGETMAFTLSMERPNTHYYHVVFRCDGLAGPTQDFKMPAWTPGYYRIMDYARNVVDFQASDAAGQPLEWRKTAKNTWRVESGKAPSIVVSYDVYAFTPSVAESYLDDTRGYITPASLFLHVAGHLRQPVTVALRPYGGWSSVATGLDPIAGRPNAFQAADFDVLYDSPILFGNQERLSFEVQGVPHAISAENMGAADRKRVVADLKRMVEGAVRIVGDIPYRHYTFLLMGAGNGGIEHSNSAAIMFQGSSLETPAGYTRWLSYVAHEFFHLYNVKRIRPVALGPFDYDRENYTNMLWVSEGFTVYYQDLILRRAGLLKRDDYLERVRTNVARFENSPGHRHQSATESSFDTWIKYFARNENISNTTISYYDKGAALGLLLDLKIRNETGNRKSLDDVMRGLYERYYKELRRGFTDEEFRKECEKAAGGSLAEIFDVYASTVKDIDYPKYFAYAGLKIDVTPRDVPGAWFGAATQFQDGALVITAVELDSPAQNAGLSAQDRILGIDGTRVTAKSLADDLKLRRAGDRIRVLYSRHDAIREVDATLGTKTERSFSIQPLANPSPLQVAILKDWLREE
jgi:predicted metalloprotease with PDZ domain